MNWPLDRLDPATAGRRRRLRLPGWRLLAMLALTILIATSGDNELTHLERINARGSLIMLTVNGASTYYQGAQGETGFEYDLATRFSDFIDVPLEVVTLPDLSALIGALEAGQGDFIAANLSRAVGRQVRLRFGPSYDSVAPVVVYRGGSARPDDFDDLRGGRLALLQGTSYEATLRAAAPDLDWETPEGVSIEDLFEQISNEELDYTIVDSNILKLNRRFFPEIRPGFEIDSPQELAWASLRTSDDTLVQRMREFFVRADQLGILADLKARHYDHIENYEPVGTFNFQRQLRDRLPQLRAYFEQAAAETGLDWRLLAAVGYQESHWNPDAVSPTGVRGVMMLTQRTARSLGIEDREDPQQSIDGGARYILRMMDRLPARIQEPDRTWLALAAYNVGYGHLEDARVLTERLGGDPDRWLDVRDHLPLLTQERWYSQTRFGYARGYEPVNYVENIRTFYDILLWMEGREHPLLAEN
jgi:membrane-bound lytic murein transglycosylase F